VKVKGFWNVTPFSMVDRYCCIKFPTVLLFSLVLEYFLSGASVFGTETRMRMCLLPPSLPPSHLSFFLLIPSFPLLFWAVSLSELLRSWPDSGGWLKIRLLKIIPTAALLPDLGSLVPTWYVKVSCFSSVLHFFPFSIQWTDNVRNVNASSCFFLSLASTLCFAGGELLGF
jgi:hypothetical protein